MWLCQTNNSKIFILFCYSFLVACLWEASPGYRCKGPLSWAVGDCLSRCYFSHLQKKIQPKSDFFSGALLVFFMKNTFLILIETFVFKVFKGQIIIFMDYFSSFIITIIIIILHLECHSQVKPTTSEFTSPSKLKKNYKPFQVFYNDGK